MSNKSIFFLALLLAAKLFTFPGFTQSAPSDIFLQRHIVIATTGNGPISMDRLLYYALRNTGDDAEALEKAAIAGDYEFVRANNQSFIDATLRLLTGIEEALMKSQRDLKPVRDKPGPALLAGLLNACESFDIDRIDAVMAEIESHEYNPDEGLVTWLRENVDKGKYKAIKETLLAFINKEV